MKSNKKFAQKLNRHSYFLRKIELKTGNKDSQANGGRARKSLRHSKHFSPHSYVTRLNVQNSPITLCKTTSFSLHRNRSRPTGKLTSKNVLSPQHQGMFSISTQMNNFQGFQLPAFASSNKASSNNRLKVGLPRYVTRFQFIKLKDKLPFLKKRIMNALVEDKLSKLKRKNRKSLLRRRYITRYWLRLITQLRFSRRSHISPSKVTKRANYDIKNNSNETNSVDSNLINENSVMNAGCGSAKEGEIILSDTDPTLIVTDQMDVSSEGNSPNVSDNFSSCFGSSNVPTSLVTFTDSQNLDNFRKNQMNNEEKTTYQPKEVKDILIDNVNATHPNFNMDIIYLNVNCEILSDGKVPEGKMCGVQMAHNSCFTGNLIQEGTHLKMRPIDVVSKEPINGEGNSGDEDKSYFLTPIGLNSSTATENEAQNKYKKLIQTAQPLIKFVPDKEISWKACVTNENDTIEQCEELFKTRETTIRHMSSDELNLKSPRHDSNLPESENYSNSVTEEDSDDERSSTPKLHNFPEDSLNELMEEFRNGHHDCSYYQLDREFSKDGGNCSLSTPNQGSEKLHSLQRLSTVVPVTTN